MLAIYSTYTQLNGWVIKTPYNIINIVNIYCLFVPIEMSRKRGLSNIKMLALYPSLMNTNILEKIPSNANMNINHFHHDIVEYNSGKVDI